MRRNREPHRELIGELNDLLHEVYRETGREAEEISPLDGWERWIVRGKTHRSLVISWKPPSAAEEPVTWRMHWMKGDELTREEAGTFPKKRPRAFLGDAIAALTDRASPRLLRPRGRFVSVLLGATTMLILAVFVRAIFVGLPPVPSSDAFSRAVAGAQQILTHLGFGDLPMVLIGSVVNEPVIGFMALACFTFALFTVAMPQVQFSHDLVSVKAGMLILAIVFFGGAAFGLAPFPANVLILAGVLAVGGCYASMQRLDAQLSGWLRSSRDAQQILRDLEARDAPSALAPDAFGRETTLGELADHVTACTDDLRSRIRQGRDRALQKKGASRLYYEARVMSRALAAEMRALRPEGKAADAKAFERWRRRDPQVFAVRKWVAFTAPGLASAVLALALLASPTPWSAPHCVTVSGTSSTLFPLGAGGAYLDPDTRAVVMMAGEDASFASGACVAP